LIRPTLEPDGVLVASIDMPGRPMNVFSADLMDALDALMDRVDSDAAVHSVVLTSAKSSFLAGADLVMVRGFTDSAKTLSTDQMFELCGRLGRQFVRLEASAKPWVAAVNGIALGGGLNGPLTLFASGFKAFVGGLIGSRVELFPLPVLILPPLPALLFRLSRPITPW